MAARRLLNSHIVDLRPHQTIARTASIVSRISIARHISNSRSTPQNVQAFYSQLSNSTASSVLSSLKTARPISQTLTEKIVQRYAVGLPDGKFVKSSDYVTLQPYKVMSHDNSYPISLKFMSIGATKIKNPDQIVITIDHDVQNKSEKNLRKYRNIEEFAKRQGVDWYPPGRGIGHQIMVEEGYAWPGTLAVASDSHSNHYGGVGCLGTPIVRTDAASIWATGKTWWQIPPVAKVMFTGTLPEGTTGKDVIAALCGFFKNDEVLNHAIEFTGSEETMRSLPIDARLTIANQSTEWGGLSGLFPIDSMLKAWLRAKATEYALYDSNTAKRFNHQRLDELFKNPLEADKGAKYAKYLTLNLSTLCPYVSGPNSVKVATPLAELESQNIKVDRAYVISCTNSRRSDLAAAARVFKEAAKKNNNIIPKIPDHVNFYIAAASLPEQKAAEEQGDWQALLDAGAQDLPAACGACIGLGVGLLEPGEIGISASNRNFKARMGSREAQAYLASPEVVAASALAGKISGPGWYKKPADWVGVEKSEGEPFAKKSVDEALEAIIGRLDSIIHASSAPSLAESGAGEGNEDTLTKLYPGFPEKIKGEIVFCDADNLNTDGIYPGKYTYQDDVPAKKMAEVCMENFDPAFRELAKPGDILVSGFNFGCGSSREQAATAILAKGIPLVIAGSFGNIFSRNSINNALMGVEVPKLIHRLREVFTTSSSQDGKESGEKVLTRRTGWTLEWDVRRSKVTITESDGKSWSQKVAELPPNVQEVIASGGLEKWVKAQIGT